MPRKYTKYEPGWTSEHGIKLIERLEKNDRRPWALWECPCGKRFESRICTVTYDKKKSCGCLPESKRVLDRYNPDNQYRGGTSRKYKKGWVSDAGLKLLKRVTLRGRTATGTQKASALFECHCGETFEAEIANVVGNLTQSCGCFGVGRGAKLKTRAKKNGVAGHPLYSVWNGMKDRCNNQNSPSFPHYGGRGISVCKRWEDFETFVQDIGERPSDEYTLDRIDVDGDYEPSNMRWANSKLQLCNRRKWLDNHPGERPADVEGAEWLPIAANRKVAA